jgi:DNA-binding HxlR family transcriptional regulator
MTKEEKRFQEKIKAIQDTMYVIGGKWKIAILLSIYSGNKRFNEISSSIPKITNRVLSKELKHLEEIAKPLENWGKKAQEKDYRKYPASFTNPEAINCRGVRK